MTTRKTQFLFHGDTCNYEHIFHSLQPTFYLMPVVSQKHSVPGVHSVAFYADLMSGLCACNSLHSQNLDYNPTRQAEALASKNCNGQSGFLENL